MIAETVKNLNKRLSNNNMANYSSSSTTKFGLFPAQTGLDKLLKEIAAKATATTSNIYSKELNALALDSELLKQLGEYSANQIEKAAEKNGLTEIKEIATAIAYYRSADQPNNDEEPPTLNSSN